MAQVDEKAVARFAAVASTLGRRPNILHSKAGSRLFGSETLKVHDKIFAMLSSEGHFVVDPRSDVEWLLLAREALEFVGT